MFSDLYWAWRTFFSLKDGAHLLSGGAGEGRARGPLFPPARARIALRAGIGLRMKQLVVARMLVTAVAAGNVR